VLLVDGHAPQRVTRSRVIPGVTSSDHQAITFVIEVLIRAYVQRSSRFNLERGNHAAFELEFSTRNMLRSGDLVDLDVISQNLSEDIPGAAEAFALRRPKRKRVRPPWWSADLTRLRRQVRAAARQTSSSGDRLAYNIKRNAYTSMLRKNKVITWRCFCTLEGKLPWSKLFCWMKSGDRPPPVIALMRQPDGTVCRNIDESLTVLLNELIQNDPLR